MKSSFNHHTQLFNALYSETLPGRPLGATAIMKQEFSSNFSDSTKTVIAINAK